MQLKRAHLEAMESYDTYKSEVLFFWVFAGVLLPFLADRARRGQWCSLWVAERLPVDDCKPVVDVIW